MEKVILKDLGFNSITETTIENENLERFELGRVVVEHKERYVVQIIEGSYNAEITGNLLFFC